MRPVSPPLRRSALALASALAAYGCGAASAKTVEETARVDVAVVDPRGRLVAQSIEVAIFRDDARPLAPYLLLNHGRSGQAAVRAAVAPAQYAANARYFVGLGFAVFLPIRIGYGATGGPDVENSGRCERRDYRPVFEAAAAQSRAVVAFARAQSYVDAERGLIVGQSFGGTTAIALSVKPPPGALAAVNFAGGGGGDPLARPENPCSAAAMTALFAAYGGSARIPTQWLYSENDKYWGPNLPRQWFEAFRAGGGRGEFAALPPYKDDGHPSFTGNPESWKPAFEAFLRACCATVAPSAAIDDGAQAYSRVLVEWAAKHKLRQAALVVRRDGRIAHKASFGGADPDAPVHLASLSKAITGACVATLVRDNRLGFDTPLDRALARFFAAHGRPADRRIARVTVAQLLTHRAGFAGAEDGEDAATGAALRGYLAAHSSRAPPAPAYLAAVFAAGLMHEPGTKFVYSNAGYLVLGAAVEEATGRSYEDYCRASVLAPAGAQGALDPAWRVMSAYGGWSMAGSDYLAFYEQLDPRTTRYGGRVRDWVLDRNDKALGAAGGPHWYGLGVRMRDLGRGVEIRHTGSWRRRLPADAGGPIVADIGNFALRLADGTSFFVASTPLILGAARDALDRELARAHAGAASRR